MNISQITGESGQLAKIVSTEIIVASRELSVPEYSLGPAIERAKNQALILAATISQCTTAEECQKLGEAQVALTKVSRALEKQREEFKKPLLEAGRRLDRMVKVAVEPIDKALGVLSELNSEWVLSERRRVQEEDRLREAEIVRIEREKLAEIARIQREQDEKNEIARKAQEDADRAAREATTKRQKELAGQEQAKADQAALEAREQAAQTVVQTAIVEQKAAEAVFIESKPTKPTKAAGQISRDDWEITSIDIWKVAKFRPDLIDPQPRIAEIKSALDDGQTIIGLSARRVIKSAIRLQKDRVIDV